VLTSLGREISALVQGREKLRIMVLSALGHWHVIYGYYRLSVSLSRRDLFLLSVGVVSGGSCILGVAADVYSNYVPW
jgi:hypothetical protein